MAYLLLAEKTRQSVKGKGKGKLYSAGGLGFQKLNLTLTLGIIDVWSDDISDDINSHSIMARADRDLY